MKANKKKAIVLVAMVLLLVATGCLNYFLNVKGVIGNAGNNNGDDGIVTPTFFASYRTDRELTRQQQIQLLDEIIASETSSEEAVTSAQAEKLNMTKLMEQELILEGLIKAKGFEDCVVTMSTTNVNVVVMDSELSQDEAAIIQNVIVSEANYPVENIVVIPYV